MRRLRFDLIANTLGQGWAVVASLLFAPVFVHQLGAEGYGLIALLPVVSALALVLDGGTAMTLNREMSRATSAQSPDNVRSTAWTLLIVHSLIGMVVAVLVLTVLPLIGATWLQAGSLTAADLHRALLLLAVVVCLQWPVSFFQNGLMGLGQQWRVNAALAVYATTAYGGAAALLVLVASSPAVFFEWLMVCTAAHATILATMFWRALPPQSRPLRFERATLRGLWRFSAGSFGISVSGVILTHADRLVASRLLSLEQFGYYGLATTLGRGVYPLVTPIFSAAFPRFSAFVARNDRATLAHLYSLFTQIMSAALFPVAAVVFWMGHDVAYAWLGDTTTAQAVAASAGLLVLGSALNGVMNIPYALQMSSGLTKLGLQISAVLMVVAFPTAMGLYAGFGLVGIAAMWLVVNVLYAALSVPLIHRATGVGHPLRWLFFDAAPAAAISFTLVGVFCAATGPGADRSHALILVGAALVLAYGSVWTAAPVLRREAVAAFRRFRGATP